MITRADYLNWLEQNNRGIATAESCVAQQVALVERLPIGSKKRVEAEELLLRFEAFLEFMYQRRGWLQRELDSLVE